MEAKLKKLTEQAINLGIREAINTLMAYREKNPEGTLSDGIDVLGDTLKVKERE